MAYSLAGYSLGIIQEENVRKEAILTVMPAYLLDSSDTYVFDFGGTQRTISITGKYSGTLAEIQTFINNIQGLIQGHQDINAGYPKDYVSDLLGTVKVKIMDFEFNWTAGEPNTIFYTLKLIEASTQI